MWRRSSVGLSDASSGVGLARMPSSPTAVRVETWRTSPLKTSPSGVRTSTSTMCSAAIVPPRRPRPLGVGGDLVDAALHVEGALGELVVLAVEDLAEAAHRLVDG